MGTRQAKQLSESEMQEFWEQLGGDRVYLEYRLSTLLCRYRSSVLLNCDDSRLKAFLRQHWTLAGPCFGRFPKMNCRKDVRELHKRFE